MELHEAIGDRRPEGLYDAALARMAAGFRGRSPSLILAAEALLTELEAHAVRVGLTSAQHVETAEAGSLCMSSDCLLIRYVMMIIWSICT